MDSVLRLDPSLGVQISHPHGIFDGGVAICFVTEDHFVVASAVGEIVVDALLFHEAAGEVEVRLPVLDAVVPWLEVGSLGVHLEIPVHSFLEPSPGQDLAQDLRDRLMLEDAALGPLVQELKAGSDLDPVGDVVVVLFPLADADADATEKTRRAAGPQKVDRHRLTQQLLEDDQAFVFVFDDDVELKVEALGNPLVPAEAHEEQDVLAILGFHLICRDRHGAYGL